MTDCDRLKLPPFPIPFKNGPHFPLSQKHPKENQLEGGARHFRDRHKLFLDEAHRQRLDRFGCGRLATQLHRDCSDEMLHIATDFLMWIFAFDDEVCDEGPLSMEPIELTKMCAWIQRTLESPEHLITENRYADALHEIRCRLDLHASPTQLGRFVEAIRISMKMEVWKAFDPAPSLNDCLLMRAFSGFGWAVSTLQHIGAGSAITQDEYEDRRVRALTEMMVCLLMWDNDPYSYNKEQARAVDGKQHNIISVICREYGCSTDQAVTHYLDIRWRVISLFLRLRRAVYVDASVAVRTYIEDLVELYCGAMHWTQSNCRYGSADGLGLNPHLIPDELTDNLPPESFRVLALPWFDWWWEYDPARQPTDCEGPP
ncbi:terpene synthase family protein [Pseudomonas mandelii]|uniref:terpene synthase family protein n=1 Tax=Pseudomonas mandelii TaxID=75612 RepID=UPI00209C72CA|nr:terpene synthase family protein [Pseudomonas mandelii]MCO8309056.1 terpene synthase family protein [Pseudomonas mandelii]